MSFYDLYILALFINKNLILLLFDWKINLTSEKQVVLNRLCKKICLSCICCWHRLINTSFTENSSICLIKFDILLQKLITRVY